jgi:hypothetical protein
MKYDDKTSQTSLDLYYNKIVKNDKSKKLQNNHKIIRNISNKQEFENVPNAIFGLMSFVLETIEDLREELENK